MVHTVSALRRQRQKDHEFLLLARLCLKKTSKQKGGHVLKDYVSITDIRTMLAYKSPGNGETHYGPHGANSLWSSGAERLCGRKYHSPADYASVIR